ncbi:MAG: nuclear transport factor 2 family protein [Bacteroidota bacterium]
MIKIRILAVLLMLPFCLLAQNEGNEEKAIEKVILGYIENFFTNDFEEMEIYLHERLAKRGINQGGRLSKEFSKSELKALMNSKQALPLKYQSNKVDSIFIDRSFSSAILSTGYPNVKWKEYIHLAKLDGKWQIMNVFWNFDKL